MLAAPVASPRFEATLAGFTVGITADRRWEEQAELLARRGAALVHGPTIRTLPVGPDEELFEVTESLLFDPPDYVIANTGIGMRAWMAAADSWGLGDSLLTMLKDSVVLARGPKASAAVHQSGVPVAAKAASERLEELVTLLLDAGVVGRRIAFQRHGDDSPDPILRLRKAGAIVVEVPVYRWILPLDLEPAKQLIGAVVDGTVHAVTFTSAPALRNFFLIAAEMGREGEVRKALNGTVIPMVVGPVCCAAGVELGLVQPMVPDRYRIGPMIRLLTDELMSKGRRVSIGGVPASIANGELRIGGEVVPLSGRESALLAALVEAAPRVLSRQALLERAWPAGTDPHVIDVTVSRLRRRLGPLGDAIVAVPRRGYCVRP